METRNSIRALVIEDDHEMANLLKRIIANRFSIEVEVAYDCATARRKLLEDGFDIVTLDYRLPDGAGLDLLDEITEGGRDHPPVIMVTGHGDEETAARSFRSRASGYVVKDAKLPEMLVDAVEKALAEISLKRVEKELLEEKVFIEDALNGLPDLFAVLDADGKFFRWNEKVSEVTGYSNAEISNMNVAQLFHPADRDNMLAGLERLRDKDFTIDEVVLQTKDGELRNYEISGRMLRNYDGIPVGYSGIGRDIARHVRERRELAERLEKKTRELEAASERLEHETGDRVRAEEGRVGSEELNRGIFAIIPEFVLLMKPGGHVLEANEALLERVGMPAEEFLKTNYMDYFAGDDDTELRAAIAKISAGEEVRGLEVLTRNARGEEYLYEINAAPLTENGEIISILALARDVTGRKRTEDELKRLNRELEGYAQTVSHDLRTPLTAIKLAAEHLRKLWEKRADVKDLDAEVMRIAEILQASTTQAEDLIADLLALARAGQEPEEVSDVDVRETVMRIIEEHAPEIEARGVTFLIADDLGTVRANPTHIYQVFGNLIDNGIKHNTNSSPVVEVSYLGKGLQGHSYVVKDNGAGLRKADVDNIFLPYYKGENGYTGIGLTIVDKLVKLYGGSIKVYTNGGASFEFSLKDR